MLLVSAGVLCRCYLLNCAVAIHKLSLWLHGVFFFELGIHLGLPDDSAVLRFSIGLSRS